MSHGPALAPDAATTRRPHTVGASRRTGWVMVLTGIAGWLASFQLTVDDGRLLRDPTYRPPCNISPVVSCGSVMSSPQGSLFGFPNMLLGLGAFAAVTALGIAVLSGARLHHRLWLALDAGALVGVVVTHWLIGQSLYELNKLCPYCAVIWVVTIALLWYVTLHCLERGIVPVPRGVLYVVRDTHWVLLGAWFGVIVLLVLTRFWPYRSSLISHEPHGSRARPLSPPGSGEVMNGIVPGDASAARTWPTCAMGPIGPHKTTPLVSAAMDRRSVTVAV